MTQDSKHVNEVSRQAEGTLRLLATVTPPSGLEERVHQRLTDANVSQPSRRLWLFWTPLRRLQFAGAALVAIAVATSTWSVYHGQSQSHNQNPPQSQSEKLPATVPPSSESSSGFKSAGAERRPATVAPIRIAPTRKKPSASHAAKPPAKLATQPAIEKAASHPEN